MSLNIGFITWIVKKQDFSQFLSSKVGAFMVSEEVETRGMRWYCKCYPNGSKHKYEGWVGLSLSLKRSSIPSHLKHIIVRYYLYESQSSAISRGIARFNNDPDDGPSTPSTSTPTPSRSVLSSNGPSSSSMTQTLSSSLRSLSSLSLNLSVSSAPSSAPKDLAGRGRGGYAKSNGTNYLVELESLKRFDIVILKCEFEIVRMYRLNKALCYGSPLRLHKVVSFEWNIGDRHLQRLRATANPYTRFYSQQFGVWNLVLIPCATTIGSKDNLSLRLRLHELPPSIESISIIVRLSSAQFGVSWTSVCELSYKSPWVSWPPSTLKKQAVDDRIDSAAAKGLTAESLTFECRLEVLSVTMFRSNNVRGLKVSDHDSRYKALWNRHVVDRHNVFMKLPDGDRLEMTEPEEDDYDPTEYDLSSTADGAEDEEMKEEAVRMELLRSVDVGDWKQRGYLMQTVYAMKENERILRRQNGQNLKMIKQLQSMMHSMQKQMASMKTAVDAVHKERAQKDDDEQFLKKMKREKAKRDRVREDEGHRKRAKHKKRRRSKSEKNEKMEKSVDSKADCVESQSPNKSDRTDSKEHARNGIEEVLESKEVEIMSDKVVNDHDDGVEDGDGNGDGAEREIEDEKESKVIEPQKDGMDGDEDEDDDCDGDGDRDIDGDDDGDGVIAINKVSSAKQQLLRTWLEMVVHLPQYFELFVEAGYEDLSYLQNMKMTELDLQQIGVEKPGHRHKILHEIQNMKQSANAMDAPMHIPVEHDFATISNADIDTAAGGDAHLMVDDFYLDVDDSQNVDDATAW